MNVIKLLINFFSNDSDFCFHVPIHEILDQKSLYGRKCFVSEKKNVTKIFEKKTTFFKIITEGELFPYIFGIYKKFGGNNPAILTLTDLVAAAT